MKKIILIIVVLLWLTGCASALRPISNATHGDILEAEIYQKATTTTATAEPTWVPTAVPAVEEQPLSIETPTPEVVETAVPDYIFHVVKAGETLTKIARRYGVTVEQLVRDNGIADPNRISVGQQLIIVPGPKANGAEGAA